jgi:hypothetical protein
MCVTVVHTSPVCVPYSNLALRLPVFLVHILAQMSTSCLTSHDSQLYNGELEGGSREYSELFQVNRISLDCIGRRMKDHVLPWRLSQHNFSALENLAAGSFFSTACGRLIKALGCADRTRASSG